MNTEGLKPIDARTMKPGDPVVGASGATGRLIAYVPEASASNQAVVYFADANSVYTYTFDGRPVVGADVSVFLPPDPDPIDPSPGNADKLRKSQVGEGWRIVEHSEKPDRRAEWWDRNQWNGGNITPRNGYPYCTTSTYRVPIAPIKTVPMSMEDFVGKPWPLVKHRDGVSTILTVSSREVVVANIGFMNFNRLRDVHPISWDHGVTWVKAEKEEQPQQPISPGHP